MTQTLLDLELTLAKRIKSLRIERNWSLETLAEHSGVSRATLSRIEKHEVSPTAQALGKLCTAFSITLSHLMLLIESPAPALIKRAEQSEWEDKVLGFKRRNISPPAPSFSGEMLECELAIGSLVEYDAPPKPSLEHHIFIITGTLQITLGDISYTLNKGDCLRYKLQGSSSFKVLSDSPAHYVLVLI